MTEPTVAPTCRRGHERNETNTREHFITRNGKQQVVRTCLRCLEITRAAKRQSARAESSAPVVGVES